MSVVGTVDFQTHRVEDSKLKNYSDCIAIEEPLEVAIKYFVNDHWVEEPLSVTMRTPGDDEYLVYGILFSEGIIKDKSMVESIEPKISSENKGSKNNSLLVTLAKGVKLDSKKLQRHFMVNSSCGVCGKATIDSIEIAYEPTIEKIYPIINTNLIIKLPEVLKFKQRQFADTGGVHASALFDSRGKIIHLSEDIGRHNALDKLIGYSIYNKKLNPIEQFVMCSGRLSFEILQKSLVAGIGMIVGIGPPTSLAIDLAKRFDITLIGFIKKNRYNIYNGDWRIILTKD
jgi:FdhD protein